eukprot:COSAG02_NODE_14736_length_1241_cov_2.683888_1_plen_185_part_00
MGTQSPPELSIAERAQRATARSLHRHTRAIWARSATVVSWWRFGGGATCVCWSCAAHAKLATTPDLGAVTLTVAGHSAARRGEPQCQRHKPRCFRRRLAVRRAHFGSEGQFSILLLSSRCSADSELPRNFDLQHGKVEVGARALVLMWGLVSALEPLRTSRSGHLSLPGPSRSSQGNRMLPTAS